MIPNLSQEALTQYASDAQTIQQPQGADYSRGVSVGRTIPAKWWNWLFSNATKRIVQSRNDADNMFTEMKNVVTDAGLTPSASDNTQLTQAIEAKTDEQINGYVETKKGFIDRWIICSNSGLLEPYPVTSGSNTTYNFKGLHRVGGVYFALNYTSIYSVDARTNRLVYSYDLEKWYSLAPSDLGASSAIDSSFRFCAGVVYFNNAWYITLYGAPSSSSGTAYTALIRVPDLTNLATKTVISNTSFSSFVNKACYLFVLDNTLCWKSNAQSTGYDVAISTDGINFSALTTGVNFTNNQGALGSNNWCACRPIVFGNHYILGNVRISMDLSTWELLGTYTAPLTPVYKLANGGIVYSDASQKTTYFASGASEATVVDYDLRHVTFDNTYVILRNTSGTFITRDFASIAATKADIIYAEPVDGVFYVSENGHIYKSIDVMTNAWEDTGAVTNRSVYTLPGLPYLVQLNNGKFSRDFGFTWLTAKDTDGNDFCPTSISFVEGNRYYWVVDAFPVNLRVKPTVLYYAVRSVNYVQGHTLYLR